VGNVNNFCIINISAIVSTPKHVFKLLTLMHHNSLPKGEQL